MAGQRTSSRLTVAAALGSLYIVWGTTYLAIRVAIQSIPPLLLAATVFTIAGPALVAIVIVRGGWTTGLPPARHWLSAVLVGIGLVTFGNGSLMWGEQLVPSGIAAIVVATVPAWLALFARVYLRERLRRLTVAGLGLGFGGLVILAAPTGTGVGDLRGVTAVLLTAIGWAAGSVYSKRAPLPADPFLAAGMQMFCGGLVTLFVAISAGELGRLDFARAAPQSAIAFAYLLVVGAIFAFGVFQWLVRNAQLSVVGTYAYVNPIVAVVLGALFLGERLTVRTLGAGAVILVGVAVIVAAQAVTSEPSAVETELSPSAAVQDAAKAKS